MSIRSTLLAVFTSATLVIAAAAPADASAEISDSPHAIEVALAMQPPTPITSAFPHLGDQLRRDGATVSAPTGQGRVLELTLPGRAATARSSENLEVGVTKGAGYATAIENSGSGTFRALIEIESANAPTAYSFSIGDDTEIVPLEDGGASVRDTAGNLIGVFEPAWAVDANGRPVRTWYEIRGSTLIQHVGFTSSTAFPVVADPFWIPALFVMARLTGHVVLRAAQRGVSEQLIKEVVQNGRRSAGNKGTSVFTQGSGKNKIRVVVDNKTGEIVTVTKG